MVSGITLFNFTSPSDSTFDYTELYRAGKRDWTTSEGMGDSTGWKKEEDHRAATINSNDLVGYPASIGFPSEVTVALGGSV
jgi:hypothetical protein